MEKKTCRFLLRKCANTQRLDAGRKRRAPWGVGILLLLPMFFPNGSWAAEIHVTSKANSGAGSLRAAVAAANATADLDTIVFDIPANDANSITVYSTIQVTQPLRIEGSQHIVGGASTALPTIFSFTENAAGSVVKDLALVTSYNALFIESAGTSVTGCRIGMDFQDHKRGNVIGLWLQADGGVVGGSTPAERNIISGNSEVGVFCLGTARARILGNYIGADTTGNSPVGNGFCGVYLTAGCKGSRIGGVFGSEGNLISANGGSGSIDLDAGITIDGADCSGNTVCGNIIGLNQSQTLALPNKMSGVVLYKASGNFIGLPLAGYHNVIAGNNAVGIQLSQGSAPPVNPRENIIQNNYIGISAMDDTAFSNGLGIACFHADANLIGGDANTPQRNVISGNLASHGGLEILGDGNTVSGNYIGTDAGGDHARPNQTGITIISGSGNVIGSDHGAGFWPGNVISGNADYGIFLSGGSRTWVKGNIIGLDRAGDAVLPNHEGIRILAADTTLVGGHDGAWRNIIAGNSGRGILAEAGLNTIQGNYIGTNLAGTAVRSNAGGGITLYPGTGTLIGGVLPGAGNVICGSQGIIARHAGSCGSTITGNWIGVLPNGSVPGGMDTGIYFGDQAHGNLVGLRSPALGNLIAGVQTGVALQMAGDINIGIYANTICAFSGLGIDLGIDGPGAGSGSNLNQASPQIQYADFSYVSGTAGSNDYVEVFGADRGPGLLGGSLQGLGATMADSAGRWELALGGFAGNQSLCALASNAQNNTSEFSANVFAPGPTPTATPTRTPLPTHSPTATVSGSPTFSPTVSPTVTISATPSLTPTGTATDVLAGIDLRGREALVVPNPAKGAAQFILKLKTAGEVTIDIYNLPGERIASVKKFLPAGRTEAILWDCASVAPGVYIANIRLPGQDKNIRKKIAVLK